MTITIALYKGRSRLSSRLIAWWLRSPYSHCELVLRTVADVSECASSSWMDGGVRIKHIRLEPAHWDFLTIEADPDWVRAWFGAHKGQPYDWLGLFGFVIRRIKGWRGAWWCSEACAAALGWPDPWRFDPAAFAAIAKVAGKPVARI